MIDSILRSYTPYLIAQASPHRTHLVCVLVVCVRQTPRRSHHRECDPRFYPVYRRVQDTPQLDRVYTVTELFFMESVEGSP